MGSLWDAMEPNDSMASFLDSNYRSSVVCVGFVVLEMLFFAVSSGFVAALLILPSHYVKHANERVQARKMEVEEARKLEMGEGTELEELRGSEDGLVDR